MSEFQIRHETIGGQVIFGPVFNKTFLKAVFELQQDIEKIGQNDSGGLEHICFAPMTSIGEAPTTSRCVIQSLFGYFKNDMDAFEEEKPDAIDPKYTINYLNTLAKCLGYVSLNEKKTNLKYLWT